jgi:hypothetical protein
MDDAGLPARHAADQLGHSRVSITQDTYYGRSTSNTRAAPTSIGVRVKESIVMDSGSRCPCLCVMPSPRCYP